MRERFAPEPLFFSKSSGPNPVKSCRIKKDPGRVVFKFWRTLSMDVWNYFADINSKVGADLLV